MVAFNEDKAEKFPRTLQLQANRILTKVFSESGHFDQFMDRLEKAFRTKSADKQEEAHRRQQFEQSAETVSLLKRLIHSLAKGNLTIDDDVGSFFLSNDFRKESIGETRSIEEAIIKSRKSLETPNAQLVLGDTWEKVIPKTPDNRAKMEALLKFFNVAEKEFQKANRGPSSPARP